MPTTCHTKQRMRPPSARPSLHKRQAFTRHYDRITRASYKIVQRVHKQHCCVADVVMMPRRNAETHQVRKPHTRVLWAAVTLKSMALLTALSVNIKSVLLKRRRQCYHLWICFHVFIQAFLFFYFIVQWSINLWKSYPSFYMHKTYNIMYRYLSNHMLTQKVYCEGRPGRHKRMPIIGVVFIGATRRARDFVGNLRTFHSYFRCRVSCRFRQSLGALPNLNTSDGSIW